MVMQTALVRLGINSHNHKKAWMLRDELVGREGNWQDGKMVGEGTGRVTSKH